MNTTSDRDVTVAPADLDALLDRVNDATKLLQRSKSIPEAVAQLVDSFEPTLGAATPLALRADPYLSTTLWAAAFRADKALRHDNDEEHRRQYVRVALEQFRQALRDIIENRAFDDEAPVRDVLKRTSETLAAPQKTLAELLGVSIRQLQRWLSQDGSDPLANDAARIRAVGSVVNQLRHVFTGPGVMSWFEREHPVLKQRPIEMLEDPLCYPAIVAAANAARAQTA